MSMWAAGAGALALVWLAASRRHRRKPVPVVVTDPPLVVEDPETPDVDDSERLQDIAALLEEFVSPTPRPGFFYAIRKNDNLWDIARAALKTVGEHSDSALLSYMFCLQSGPRWNLPLYGTPSVTKSFPKKYLVPHMNLGVRVAFLPRNMDALELMRLGIKPVMVVDPKTGAPIGKYSSYGLLWLPPVDEESLASGDPTCADFSWSDGSSTIDPPPQLLMLLEAA